MLTLREPHAPQRFPITSPYWPECETGAQMADLVRAEELRYRGGVYIDSDVEVWRPFTPLLALGAFAGYEDQHRVGNAVMGFTAGHPALFHFMRLAIEWRSWGTIKAGVATFTEVVTALVIHVACNADLFDEDFDDAADRRNAAIQTPADDLLSLVQVVPPDLLKCGGAKGNRTTAHVSSQLCGRVMSWPLRTHDRSSPRLL
jgi:hypothetical protein